ncbi:MAG: GDP-mannose 4,6-dehydratase [Anaerolinea sp.]|nr:GDP-mannose 4,6-dehydratase [Anaerolinea sp.]MCC6974397.1 GDP-mannose 4,6-dehydratase [Anaerolineae bacterium]CAG0955998.1 UDP-glucuronate 4-epimerase [Anaerolineae bacterium]
MAHYLVTGAAGFIASRTVEFLLEAGHTVTGIDNLNDAYDTRLKMWRLNRLRGKPGFTFYQVDIADRRSLNAILADESSIAGVINLAARAGVRQSVENPWVYIETNITGTLNLLELCRERGINKFVLASTSSLYGTNNPMPYREDADTNQPISPYAASKKAAEVMCYTYHSLYQIDVTVVRYFTVFGPAGRPDMSLFRFVQWINEGKPVTVFGDGKQSRDFTYVDDIARGTIAALKPLGYETINLGSDRPVVLSDVIEMVEEYLGKKAQISYVPRHPADVTATWADISQARAKLGWEPQMPFAQGVKNLVDWYRENRDWAKDIRTE